MMRREAPRGEAGSAGEQSPTRVIAAFSIVLLILLDIVPGVARAQDSNLKVTITRPGEGETLYASPTSPFASTQITGWVAADDFSVSQIQIRLEILQGTKSFGNSTATPKQDGTFSFDVAINPERPATKSSGEYGCKGDCHAITNVGLPAGPVLLRVSAVDPLGRKATAERSIISEHSGYADVPVQVLVDGDSRQVVEGLHILADTRLYVWRARQYSGSTDSKGQSLIHLEALRQMPTRYLFQIEPMVIGGVLYKSREPVQVIVPPGATQLDPVTLIAMAERGRIDGTLTPSGLENLTIRAIDLSRGASYAAKTMQGKFTFAGLPLSTYLLTVDGAEAESQGVQATPQTVDLTSRPVASMTLALAAASTRTARGIVRDHLGNPLPLAWLAGGDKKVTGRVFPSTGKFSLFGLASDTNSLWVVSPGYYARPVAIGLGELDVALTPLPDTRSIPWGTGTLTLPAQSFATLSGSQLALKRGWVWGHGTGDLVITTPDLSFALQSGSFALEYLPGENSWLYVFDGQVLVTDTLNVQTVVNAGQMLRYGKGATQPVPVAMDNAVVWALHAGEPSPSALETDPAIPARLRDVVERVGIPSTLAAAAVVILLGASGALVVRWYRRRCLA